MRRATASVSLYPLLAWTCHSHWARLSSTLGCTCLRRQRQPPALYCGPARSLSSAPFRRSSTSSNNAGTNTSTNISTNINTDNGNGNGDGRGRLRRSLLRGRERSVAAMRRMRASLTPMIPFRLPSSPSDQSRLSLSTSLSHIFNPSLISRIADYPFSQQLLLRWRRILYSLLPLGGSSHGNRIIVYSDGDQAFTAMWHAIIEAQHSIRIETYILDPDAVGIRTMELLMAASERGVSVTLIYDSAGSSSLLTNWSYIERMVASGIHVVQFNPILSWPWRRRFLFRDHRKILIVDDRIGFTGGMNVGKEYAGLQCGGTGQYRDTHLKVEGPAVLDLIKVFNDSYTEALPNAPVPLYKSSLTYRSAQQVKLLSQSDGRTETRTKLMMKKVASGNVSLPPIHEPTVSHPPVAPSQSPSAVPRVEKVIEAVGVTVASMDAKYKYPPLAQWLGQCNPIETLEESSSPSPSPLLQSWPSSDLAEDPNLFVQVLKSNVWRQSRLIQRAMVITLRSAKHRAYITTPYFTPPTRIRRAMVAAASQGVDVRLLCVGSKGDVPWSRWASMHIYHQFLDKGIRIYEMQSPILHAKTVTIDGLYASIGSFNFDRLSMLNLEVTVTTLDPDIASQLEQQFFQDLLSAKEVTKEILGRRSLWERCLHWACYRLAMLIR